ncbi:DOPA-like domain-containing protein [Lentinula aciculospora]|uniref:DOPA-like domain-containing protein n=1 Tax=Lentinula aciculospora TaxID=153920 RepID=A0A9W9DS80_9AGAR|nr:DOPA-like domain-containing protein [Lentinula aciculospora]
MSQIMDVDRTTTRFNPQMNFQTVIENEYKEWLFHIYFFQKNADQVHAALQLREAVLRLRLDGAFVAVPHFRVNEGPVGPHPVGSYEVWVLNETFASTFSYLCQNRGDLSILIIPLSKDQYRDYSSRATWMGHPLPLDLSALPQKTLDNRLSL